MTVIKVYPSSVALASDANTGSGGHHKGWDYLDNLKTSNGIAYCGYDSDIAASSGTYNTPAPIEFAFNFSNLNYDGEIAKLIVHYKQKASNANIIIDGATCSLSTSTSLNTNYGARVTTTSKEQTHVFYNFTEAGITNSNFRVRLEFPTNQATSAGRITIQDFYVEIVSAQVMIKYPQNNRITSGYTCGAEDNQYKCWDNLDDLKNQNGIAYCRNPNYSSPLIAGKNGTYKQPAPIDLTDFGFNFGDDITIEKGALRFGQQKFINNGYYPEIGGAKITLLGTSKATVTGPAVPTELSFASGISTGLTPSMVNSDKFGVRFAYPANESTTPGRILLKDVCYKIYYNDNGIRLNLDGRFNPSSVIVGQTGSATFTVKKVSSAEYDSITFIDLPIGIEITGTLPSGVTKSNQTRNGETYQRLKWVHQLGATANVSNTITVNYNTIKPNTNITDGNVCTIRDQNTDLSYKCYLNIKDITVTLNTDLYNNKKALKTDYDNLFNITYESDDPLKNTKIIKLKFADNNSPISNVDELLETEGIGDVQFNDFGDGAYSIYVDEGITSTPVFNLTIPLKIRYTTSGEYSVQIWVVTDDGATTLVTPLTKEFIVLSKDMGNLAFTRVEILKYWTDTMGSGLEYTLGTRVQATLDTTAHLINDYGDNYRIGIYNSSASYVSDENAFLEKVIWCKSIANATAKEVTVKFTYNASNPLYIVYSHGYTGDPVSKHVTFNYSEPLLVESTQFNNVTKIGHYLWTLPSVLLDSDSVYGTASFYTNLTELMPFVVYNFDDGGLFNSNVSLLGIEVMFDYIVGDTVMINCELLVDNTVRGVRDILLQSGQGTAHIGSPYDLFGLQSGELIDRTSNTIKNFEIRLTVKNPYLNLAKVQINNIILGVEYVNRTQCGYGFSIDGERGEDYGILLNEVSHNRGTNNVKSLYQVEGTDKTVINRMNIDSSEITMKIKIHNCRIKEGRYQVDKVVELFTNKRELHSNKPILKKLIFDHLDDRYYEFARVEQFDDEYRGGSYYATIKLFVPDGTTYDVQETLSGPHGFNPSTITCNPVITYISHNAGECIIRETKLDQEMLIESSAITDGCVLTINNEDRKVYVNNSIDITNSVDFTSNWFRIRGEYEFESDTGNVIEVSYRIRRG